MNVVVVVVGVVGVEVKIVVVVGAEVVVGAVGQKGLNA